MLRRLLNIASIVCLVLCVALMGMWVRSLLIAILYCGRFLGLNEADGRWQINC